MKRGIRHPVFPFWKKSHPPLPAEPADVDPEICHDIHHSVVELECLPRQVLYHVIQCRCLVAIVVQFMTGIHFKRMDTLL